VSAGLTRRLRTAAAALARLAERRSSAPWHVPLRPGPIVRLAAAYALAAAGLLFLLPVIAGVALWCATWPIGRRRRLRAVR
jgi:hypothetical protein